MEKLEAYFTKEGWKNDFQETKKDFSYFNKAVNNSFNKAGQNGDAALGLVLGIAAMPLCGYVGSYIGQGLGWVGGHIIDFIPYVNKAAPWLAHRCGPIGEGLSRHDLNVEFYQASGAIGGFWTGLWAPLKLAIANATKGN